MTSNTHACPIEGCRHTDVTHDRVMCWKHWGMVPRDLQNSVYRWKKVSDSRGRIVPEHIQAVRADVERAIAAAKVPRGTRCAPEESKTYTRRA